ncbi:hypothetical protein TNCV_4202331 [Trichonephila clavipes]|nr:hypothetical protein TNCV_4202331 [Trichonephila clavipes]
MCITVNHAGQPSKPKDVRSNCQENALLRLVHHPLPKSVPVEYLTFCLGLYAMALENLLKFKDICDGTFPYPVHEGVHEEEDISCCTMLKSYQFAKYPQQFNKLHAEWCYKVSVLPHVFCPCQRISPWWSTCSDRIVHCQHTGGWHRSQSDLYHGGSPNLLTTDKDRRANRYINELLSLKSHLSRIRTSGIPGFLR